MEKSKGKQNLQSLLRLPKLVTKSLFVTVMAVCSVACSKTWSRYSRTGPTHNSRSKGCKIRVYDKPPKGDFVVLGRVEAGMESHFTRGRATEARLLPRLKNEACALGGNAILDLKTKHSWRDDYSTLLLQAKAIAITKPLLTPREGQEKAYGKFWKALAQKLNPLRKCLKKTRALVLHTDAAGHIARVGPLERKKVPIDVLRCLNTQTEQHLVLSFSPFVSIMLVLDPQPIHSTFSK